jgi:ankyrin repeat protein
MKYEHNSKIARMTQPEVLTRDTYVPWSRGKGTDVWAMICAVIAGDLDTVKELVATAPGLANCEMEYFTPLHFAVRENRRDIVDFLLQQPINEEDAAREKLVEMARDRGYTELANFLVERRRTLYHIEPEGDLLAQTIKAGDIDGVLKLLDEQPALVHAADAGGSQPIHWAVLTRQIELIDELLKRGADINAKRPDGARPLDLTNGDYEYRSWYRDLPPTALRKHEVLIGYLIARGAYYDISVAAKIGDYQRVRKLLDEDPSLANSRPAHIGYYSGLPLRVAAGAGHIEVVKLLLERGADVNGPEAGVAPLGGALHAAISSRQYEIVKLLLEKGANANSAVESSGTCLFMAKHVKVPQEIIDLLVSHGAKESDEMIGYNGDVQAAASALAANPQKNMDWILDHAIAKEYQPVIDLVLQYQPDALKQRKTDTRAWWDNHIPTNPAFLRTLLQYGLDPNRRNWLGITLLHRCANQGSQEIAAVLLEFGADINAVETEWSCTPLGWAVREGKTDMVQWLLQQGADPAQPADEPWAWPVEWAKRKGYSEIVEMLEKADLPPTLPLWRDRHSERGK